MQLTAAVPAVPLATPAAILTAPYIRRPDKDPTPKHLPHYPVIAAAAMQPL
jgi:hypothetical protein